MATQKKVQEVPEKQGTQLSTTVADGIDKLYEMVKSGAIAVKNAVERSNVQLLRKQNGEYRDSVCVVYDPHISDAYKLHKNLCSAKKFHTDKCDAVERTARFAVDTFDAAERKRITDEQARLQAAEDERVRKEQEKLLKKAETVKTPEKQEQYRQQAAAITPSTVNVAPSFQKTEGERSYTTWKARINDIAKIPPKIYLADEKVCAAIQSKMNAFARANKDTIPVEGVQFYPETSSSVG